MVAIGRGLRAWIEVFHASGVEEVFGIEGHSLDPGYVVIHREYFRAQDLRRSLDLGSTFDLAVSLDVAEHLPQECEETLIASLPRVAAGVERTDSERLAQVHPRLYERNNDLRRRSLRDVLAVVPHLTGSAGRRRLRAGTREPGD